jgi:hypothetical protein
MKKKLANKIDSWGIYGVKTVHIAVSECEIDGQKAYNPQITIILDEWGDDTKETLDAENTKAITIAADSFYADPKEALFVTLKGGLHESFELVSSTAMLFDSDMNQIAEYDFNTDFDDLEEEWESAQDDVSDYGDIASAMRELRKGKVTIH